MRIEEEYTVAAAVLRTLHIMMQKAQNGDLKPSLTGSRDKDLTAIRLLIRSTEHCLTDIIARAKAEGIELEKEET